MKMLGYINTRGGKLSPETKSRVIIFSQCVNHPNTFIQGQYVFLLYWMPNDSGVHYIIRRIIVKKIKSHKLR